MRSAEWKARRLRIGNLPHLPCLVPRRSCTMAITVAKSSIINPVYGSYFADPFVWKHRDVYYAIGTGAAEANGQTVGKIFPILQSEDLLSWQFAAGGLVRPNPQLGTHFWAPAVAYAEGQFYLYYSVGHEDKHHQLRVATSNAPQGPYLDSGKVLLDPTGCPFAIDPHPFQDVDGSWYLFYARDFLDASPHARAGTGLAVKRMKNMTSLEGQEMIVLRPRSDWQRFQAERQMYGRIWDWHTLEGPCICRHQNKYFCLYSGGRWETENYGVDYGVADHVLGPYSDQGNESGPRVLRSVPGRMSGPGHNSTVVGPDRHTEYLVYHAWDQHLTKRQMCVAPLIWTSDGPRCEGHSTPT